MVTSERFTNILGKKNSVKIESFNFQKSKVKRLLVDLSKELIKYA